MSRTTEPISSRIADSSAAGALIPIYDGLSRRLDELGLLGSLRGESVGRALHPAVSDLPIGLWASTSVLDLLGGRSSRRAATLLCALGTLSALPTAAAGTADWSGLDDDARRLGVVHAAASAAAVTQYGHSTWLRLRGHHLRAAAHALAGGLALLGAAGLGRRLALDPAVVNRRETPEPPAPAQATEPTGEASVRSHPRSAEATGYAAQEDGYRKEGHRQPPPGRRSHG